MAALQQRLAGWRIGDVDLLDLARETARASFEDDVTGVSAQMAYIGAAAPALRQREPLRRRKLAHATPSLPWDFNAARSL